ncbi:MAG: PAS domain S-box protein [Salinigranum sp.]
MTTSIRVLAVDDDPAMAQLVVDWLERGIEGLAVTTANGADEALSALESEPHVDCVVSDYDMPGRNGLELLNAVRERHGDLPFILFTGKGSEEVASQAISAGVTDYLQKSGGSECYEILTNRVRNAVDRYRAEQRVEELQHVNGVIRNVQRGLVASSTREAVERTVCEQLTQSEPYVFAWFGVPNPGTGEVEPRASAGAAREYLDRITVRADDTPRGNGPAGSALSSGTVQVVQRIGDDPRFEPWRDPAADYGFRSVAAVPVVDDAATIGVLVVYANRLDAFNDDEREILSELGETIGAAIQASEARNALAERERDLRENARRLDQYRAIVENMHEGAFLLDADGRRTFVNGRLSRVLGVRPEDVEGGTTATLRDLGVIDTETLLRYDHAIANVLTGRRDEEWVEIEFETASAGTMIAETRLTRIEADGDLRGIVDVTRDITDRKELEVRLTRTLERIGEAFVALDDRGRITHLNRHAEELLGCPAEEALDRRIADVVPGIEETRFGREYRRAVARNASVSYEAHFEPLGAWFEVRMYPTEGGVSIYFRDVTNRKRREEELKRQNRRLEEFASVISHDLKSPLNVAEGWLDVHRADCGCDDEHLVHIDEAHARMAEIIDDVLALARTRRSIDEPEVVSLPSVARAAWSGVAHGSASLVVSPTPPRRSSPTRVGSNSSWRTCSATPSNTAPRA